MANEQAEQLVTYMLNVTGNSVSEATFAAWAELFVEEEDLTFEEALAAAKASVKYPRPSLFPVDVFTAIANRRAMGYYVEPAQVDSGLS